MTSPAYVGRFAPSPTGPLHAGSLITAVASFLDARAHHGRWLVRIEDLDPPREVPGAADLIIRQLAAHGLEWDGPIRYQSQQGEWHYNALTRLAAEGLLYSCTCSRRRLLALDGRYDGACRAKHRSLTSLPPKGAMRIRVEGNVGESIDFLLGVPFGDPSDGGDFIVRRGDGLTAYQLAVAVDDAAQGITHVLRGADLIDSTPRQLYLLDRLRLQVPAYGHAPLVLGADGSKLSKQNRAPALDVADAAANVNWALRWLGMAPPQELAGLPPAGLLAWGIGHWSRDKIPHYSRKYNETPCSKSN